VVVRRIDYTCGKLGEKTRRDMLNVTHRHVFGSQKVCRHTSLRVRIRAWRRLVVDEFAWKHVGRDETYEIT